MMDKEASNQPFWALTPERAAELLGSDTAKGLSNEEAEVRLRHFGRNQFGKAEPLPKIRILLRQFKSPLIFILVISGTATMFLGEWFDSAIIFLAIGINVALGFYQENKAENTLSELRSYIEERTRVIRNGRESEIEASFLVPGDLMHVTLGSRVPADGRIVSTHDLRVDEAVLTGESMPAQKSTESLSDATLVPERHNMIFGGTLVTEGSAIALVTATGAHAEFGKIAELVSGTSQEETPLQRAVAKLAWIIAAVISLLVVGIFLLGVSRGEPLFEMFLVSIAVAVGAIPEALPIGLTAILAVGVGELARRKGIMRSLTAAETLGSTTVIMTDKTGTLTEAKMELVDVLPSAHLGSRERREHKAMERLSQEQKDILQLAAIGTDVLIENPDDDPKVWRMTGNPLEVNIVRAAALHGVPLPEHGSAAKRMLIPFNSAHKFSVSEGAVTLAAPIGGRGSGVMQIVLGAPDILLRLATLEKSVYVSHLEAVEHFSKEGKRLLGVGVLRERTVGERLAVRDVSDIEFVGMIAFYDPVREEVPQAIKRIERYGVRVVMATGDLKGTAVAVARDLGWQVGDAEVLSGEELHQLSDEELMQALAFVRVFARVTPQDKLRIAQLFQKRGEVVAMTGDGVNDAPSLKAVDIGIAVGSGSDVAKGVADLVLLDDNFNTIVAAMEEGKQVLRNIRKTFVYLMSNSLDEVVLIGGSLLAGLALPLTAIQIIWVNFFTGSLPAVAFAFDREGSHGGIHRAGDKQILNGQVKFLTIGIGVLTSLLLFVLYWWLMHSNVPAEVGKTFLFTCFASYILVVAFSFRDLARPVWAYNPFSNRFLVFGVALGLSLLLATVYIPFLQRIFDTVALSPVWLLFLALWALFNIALVEFAKWLFYRRA